MTNGEIRKRLNIKTDLMQAVMRRKLGLFGHVWRMKNSRKFKDVITVDDGGNREARKTMQRKDGGHNGLVSNRYTQIESTGTRQRHVENDNEKCTGHLRALCPWIMMIMTMNKAALVESCFSNF